MFGIQSQWSLAKSMIFRASLTLFLLTIFIIFLTLKLDGHIRCNWLVVFSSLWLFQSFFLCSELYQLISCWEIQRYRCSAVLFRKLLYICSILWIVITHVTYCYIGTFYPERYVSRYYMMAPIWTLLLLLIVDVTAKLITQVREAATAVWKYVTLLYVRELCNICNFFQTVLAHAHWHIQTCVRKKNTTQAAYVYLLNILHRCLQKLCLKFCVVLKLKIMFSYNAWKT